MVTRRIQIYAQWYFWSSSRGLRSSELQRYPAGLPMRWRVGQDWFVSWLPVERSLDRTRRQVRRHLYQGNSQIPSMIRFPKARSDGPKNVPSGEYAVRRIPLSSQYFFSSKSGRQGWSWTWLVAGTTLHSGRSFSSKGMLKLEMPMDLTLPTRNIISHLGWIWWNNRMRDYLSQAASPLTSRYLWRLDVRLLSMYDLNARRGQK